MSVSGATPSAVIPSDSAGALGVAAVLSMSTTDVCGDRPPLLPRVTTVASRGGLGSETAARTILPRKRSSRQTVYTGAPFVFVVNRAPFAVGRARLDFAATQIRQLQYQSHRTTLPAHSRGRQSGVRKNSMEMTPARAKRPRSRACSALSRICRQLGRHVARCFGHNMPAYTLEIIPVSGERLVNSLTWLVLSRSMPSASACTASITCRTTARVEPSLRGKRLLASAAARSSQTLTRAEDSVETCQARHLVEFFLVLGHLVVHLLDAIGFYREARLEPGSQHPYFK